MKRAALLASLLVLIFTMFSLVLAQDTPPDGSSLDVAPETPLPLPTRMARPAPSARVEGQGASLEVYFPALPQGQAGLLRVSGGAISAVQARFNEKLSDFYEIPGDGFYGLISADFELASGTFPLDIFVTLADGTRTVINTQVTVVLGGFIRQEVMLPPDRAVLVNAETERNELAKLESIFAVSTLERMWNSEPFQMPIAAALTSPFGAFRTFNGTLNTRHTGWDIRTTLGVPVLASAGGRVAYAGLMDIRGNYVVVDHGYGIYSGYAHFSQIHVTRGQSIAKNQVLGVTGDTGRTSGPHFHWEMAVNGEWVDTVKFLEMWMP